MSSLATHNARRMLPAPRLFVAPSSLAHSGHRKRHERSEAVSLHSSAREVIEKFSHWPVLPVDTSRATTTTMADNNHNQKRH